MSDNRSSMITALTTIELIDNRPVVVKQRLPLHSQLGSEASAAARALARAATGAEARWLNAARHGGVVRLRRVSVDAARIETDLASTATLRLSATNLTDLVVSLRSAVHTLAAVHGLGLVHGNLGPDHILVSRSDPAATVLCSPAVDTRRLEPRDDLAALAATARTLGQAAGPKPWGWDEALTRLGAATEARSAIALLDEFRHRGHRPLRRTHRIWCGGWPGRGPRNVSWGQA